MSEFKKYQHIERYGTSEVEGIENGMCYIFPKLDGTNGSIWIDDGTMQFGSRKRQLHYGSDNAGFWSTLNNDESLRQFFNKWPKARLFGEWLVPHSLKTYRDDAWRKFYVFDVTVDLPEEKPSGEKFEYISYESYVRMLEEFEIDYIPCLAKIENPTEEMLLQQLPNTHFLIKDGQGQGEGIVIKNYDFVNRYGRITWAKIVTNEFKEKHQRKEGPQVKSCKKGVEENIVEEYITSSLIEKVFSIIVIEREGWNSKYIPQLLSTVYYDLIKEDSWNFIKKYKNPRIDFKRLYNLIVQKVKKTKPELF